MSTALDRITGANPGISPGLGWDAIAGGDGTQAVWLQAFPGSVELRIQPFPRRFRVMVAEYFAFLFGGAVGILAVSYWMNDGFAEFAPTFFLGWGIGTAIGVFLLGPAVRTVRGRKSLGRVRLSDALVRIDIPTAPMWRNSFDSMPRDIRGVSVCRSPWYRNTQSLDALFGIERYEVHIERADGTRFIMSNLEYDAAEAIAAQLDLYAKGAPLEADS